jgi:acetyltransferase
MAPASTAVVGATNRRGSVGLAVFRNILDAGYQGVLYPVNPKARSIQGVKAYPSLAEVPDDIDQAVIIVPAEAVPPTLEQAAAKGVKGCVIITAGFKEVGGRGVELENKVQQISAEHGLRIVGPNCLGIINTNPAVSLNASFARITPRLGNIAFVSQSGALCTAALDVAAGRNIGFSKFISFGNKADINEVDFLRYLKDDPDTGVILLYLEDISNGRRFIEVCREITWDAKKPILAIKSGSSPEGAKAAASHTGSMAGSDSAYDAIFLQSGVQRVESINELFNYAVAFANQPAPAGKRVAIVTNAGGPGIMATDAVVRHDLRLASFSQETEERLRECLPPTANIHNPVDVIGDATHERYEAALKQVVKDPNVDGAIVILTPQAMTDILETAQIVPHVAKDCKKPILSCFMGLVDVTEGVRHLECHGIPNYTFPQAAVRAMASMVKFGWLQGLERRAVRRVAADRQAAEELIQSKLGDQEQVLLPQAEANEILGHYGFPVLRNRLVADKEQAAAAAAEIGLPVAMKISSTDILHKSDAGGVMLGIASEAEAGQAFEKLVANAKAYKPDARIDGVLVEKMASAGIEVILGASRDPRFGPVCMFGLGGMFVETLQDVSFRLAPMWEVSAEIMLQSIKSYKVLLGVRGNPPSDIDSIKDCILRLSQLVSEHPQISELDINPLLVYPEGQGCVVADSRIALTRVSDKS